MVKRIVNKFRRSRNTLTIAQLEFQLSEIRKTNAVLVLFGAPTEGNWKGIAHATVGLYPENALEIPQWYSNPVLNTSECAQVCAKIKELNFDKVVISGFAPYFFEWIVELYPHAEIEIIYHGTISEFHDPVHQKFIQQLISFGKTKKINRFGFVKEGLAEIFTKLYNFNCFHQPLNTPLIPEGVKKIELDHTKIHVGVFGADTFNKNLHNQVIHALMIDSVIVHVLDKGVFKYLGLEDRIVEHGKNLPREQFLSILGSMDLNLYMSFNESWGLVAKESEILGIVTIESEKTDYIQKIKTILERPHN
jgi:glycosyltransferase involved in cell wall biosynthesis